MPKGEYFVSIDGVVKASGNIHSDWKFLADKEITDPKAVKPSDWVDDAESIDESVPKPDGWDDIPEQIPDPDAVIPDDWNVEDDGDWEPPLIPNPEYKGVWVPTMIANPDYKGVWVPPNITNPAYVFSDTAANYTFGAVGFEIWQVKAGTVFDSIILTQYIDDIYKYGNETLESMEREKKMKIEEEKRLEEFKTQEGDDKKQLETEKEAADVEEEKDEL